MQPGAQALWAMLTGIFGWLQGVEAAIRLTMGNWGIPAGMQTAVMMGVDLVVLVFSARTFSGKLRVLLVTLTVLILIYLLQPWSKVPGAV